tara:strand:- start:1530 stop:2213 length:684 start_codon:yes stop_codon:yes gene_type:complete
MSISDNFYKIQQEVEKAASNARRATESIKILGVSKKQTADAIREAFLAGLTDFGENYLQEALPKIKALNQYPIHWHFIGPIQSNKAQDIAKNFSWVHSLDRVKVARLLDKERQTHKAPLHVCIQVNLDDEPSKSGIAIDNVDELLQAILPLNSLNIRGFMAMPKLHKNQDTQYASFLRLKELLISTNNRYNLDLDTLSMGTSQDYHPAIIAGSTIIRVGQALFGKRI